MKERPLLFRTQLVKALLDGRKTQTRRAMKVHFDGRDCPYGIPGDRIWVKETWAPNQGDERPWCEYRADCADPLAIKWRASIYMPRRLSRITLEITEVRVQRLQDITDADAKAEGVGAVDTDWSTHSPRAAFRDLWNRINGDDSWDANPYVWALTFRRLP